MELYKMDTDTPELKRAEMIMLKILKLFEEEGLSVKDARNLLHSLANDVLNNVSVPVTVPDPATWAEGWKSLLVMSNFGTRPKD